MKIRFETAIKTPDPLLRTGAGRCFDIGQDATGSVKPFDGITRVCAPEVNLEEGLEGQDPFPFGLASKVRQYSQDAARAASKPGGTKAAVHSSR